VLARPGGDVQIGIAAPRVVRGLDGQERAFVASLEGGRPVTEVERRRFAGALRALAAAGVDDGPEPHPTASRIRVIGAGAVGLAVATCLARAAEVTISLVDPAPCGVEPAGTYPDGASGSCAAAAAAALAPLVARADLDAHAPADLTIIVTAGAVDAAVARDLLVSAATHLVVACDEAGAWVSHVVVPGITACGRCRDLRLTRADPAWPLLALQCAVRRPRAGAIAQAGVAAAVTSRAVGFLSAGDTGIATRVDRRGESADAPLLPEPACGCGAAGPVGDEVAARRAAMPRMRGDRPHS
jgi:hypothetical protein